MAACQCPSLQAAACPPSDCVALWPHAGWLGAGASSKDAASANAKGQSQAARDTWRALEALLRLTASDVILGDIPLLLSGRNPETYYSMVRSNFWCNPGLQPSKFFGLASGIPIGPWFWAREGGQGTREGVALGSDMIVTRSDTHELGLPFDLLSAQSPHQPCSATYYCRALRQHCCLGTLTTCC